MDNISQSANKINEMYSNLTYMDQYFGSVLLFIILTIVLFVCVSYTHIMRNFQPIKDDWPNQKCKPNVLPFAGLINKPDNMTILEFTSQNFTNCVQDILTNIIGYAIQPITYMSKVLSNLFQEINTVLQFIRTSLSSVRSNMTNIAQEILGRVMNIMVPIQQILVSFSDFAGKVKGILTAGLYTSLSSYYALKSLLGTIVQFVISILIILVGMIVAMWILPFTWPAAAATTAIFISISIPLAIIVGFMSDVLHIHGDFSIPEVPSQPASSCFDKNTNLIMNDGSYKTILNIEVGDTLKNDIMVTAKMKLNAKEEKMYNLHGTIVSSNHLVSYENKWIPICKHPDSILIENYEEEFLYCLNTESKLLEINNDIYLDWDELYDNDIELLLNKISEIDNKSIINTKSIHKFFDGGFDSSTIIELLDNTKKEIKDVKVGDVLNEGEKVRGIVEIEGNYLSQYNFNLGNGNTFSGGPNLNICDKNLENILSTLDLTEKYSEVKTNKNKLYHLVTDKKTFFANGIKFYHYDSSIELFLERYYSKLLSIKYV